MVINTIDAIHALNPSAMCIVPRGDIDRIIWTEGTAPIAKADIEAKIVELQATEDAKVSKQTTDKANAKAKLIAGEALTEDEADTIVI